MWNILIFILFFTKIFNLLYVVQAIDPFDSSRDGKISYFEIKIENKNGESSG